MALRQGILRRLVATSIRAQLKNNSVRCPESKRKEMFEALSLPLQNKKIKIKPQSTSTEGSERAVVPRPPDTNFNMNLPTMPNDIKLDNFDVLEMDPTDDKFLSDILTQTESYLK